MARRRIGNPVVIFGTVASPGYDPTLAAHGRDTVAEQHRKKFLARSDPPDTARVYEHDLVDEREQIGPVVDDHDRYALLAKHLDGISQGVIAVAVEVGIWFVEHDQDGPAEERASQADSLPLAAGKTGAVLSYHRVVALREPLDQRVRRSQLCRLNDLLVGRSLTKPRDVVADGAGKQFNILRQITEALAESVGIEVPYVVSVDAHATLRRRPCSHQSTRQG
jgi:hypothetical protein